MRSYILNFINKFRGNRYLRYCFLYDYKKYELYSGINRTNPEYLASSIRVLCHTIEKALSLSDCKDDFGKQKIMELIECFYKYKAASSKDLEALELCRATLAEYVKYRRNRNLDVSFIPKEFQNNNTSVEVGAKELKHNIAFENFKNISLNRHSIRNYSDRKVSIEDIRKAVEIAQTAPSACNRQATRIYACLDPKKIQIIKHNHGGIRSFGTPGVIFALTQDLTLYLNEYERNTWLIDAGIFCMNMLYSLQSVGIGCCPVIWGGMTDEDNRMSELLEIPKNERIGVLIVGGYYPENNVKYACSQKRNITSILKIIK